MKNVKTNARQKASHPMLTVLSIFLKTECSLTRCWITPAMMKMLPCVNENARALHRPFVSGTWSVQDQKEIVGSSSWYEIDRNVL
jgi:hypothetical protein